MEEKMEGENPENEKRIARIKRHLKENKKVYLIAGATGISCFAAGYLLRKPNVITVINEAAAPVINNTVAPVMNNIGNQQITNFGGPMTKMVKCLETSEMWETVTDAAEAAGTSMAYMSRHLNGHKDHLYDKHYKIIGLGTAN